MLCWHPKLPPVAAVSRRALISQHRSGDFLSLRYEILKELGSGSFGVVHLVRERATGLERVIKIVTTKNLAPRLLDNMRREIQVLQDLDHPNIVRLFEFGEDTRNQKIYLLMEKLSGGDLDDLLERSGCLGEHLVSCIVRQVLSGAAFCHERGVLHRDLKPGNIMLVCADLHEQSLAWLTGCCLSPALKEGSYNCKIIDFGLSATFDPTDPGGGITDVNGTPAYMAPEVCKRMGRYAAKADVWSIGVLTYELLTGSLPFGDASDYSGGFKELFEITKQYENLESFWALMPEDHWQEAKTKWLSRSLGVRKFVSSLLCCDPEQRPSAVEALRSPWFELYRPARDGLTPELFQSLLDYAEETHFVKVCLLLIAARLGSESLEPYRAAFLGIDTEGNGSLSRAEFFEAVQNLQDCDSCCPLSRRKVSKWFEQCDLNKNGRLEYSEFLAACLHAQLHALESPDDLHGEALSNRAFSALDSDGDGRATRGDILRFFHTDLVIKGLPEKAPFDVRTFHNCLLAGDASPASSDSEISEDVHCICGARKVCT